MRVWVGGLLPYTRSARVVVERPHLQHCSAAALRWWAPAPRLHLLQRSPCWCAQPWRERECLRGCRASLPQAVPLCVGPEGVVAAAHR